MNYHDIRAWRAAFVIASAVAGSAGSTSLHAGPLARAAELDAKSVGLAVSIPSIDGAIEEFRQGRNGRALELLKGAVARRPDLPPAKLMLARMMLVSGQDAEGRSLLEEVVAEHPNRSGAYVSLGSLALAEGRVTDASLQFERAQALAAKESPAPTSPQMREVRFQCASGLASIAERGGTPRESCRVGWRWSRAMGRSGSGWPARW